MKVFFFCPDRHLVYEGKTAEETGVGGGVTMRLRIATALARLGHAVTMGCNCVEPHSYRGVQYLPLDRVKCVEAEILIVHTTGGTLDMGSLLAIPVTAALRVLLIGGTQQPVSSEEVHFDCIYACSNFIAGVVKDRWSLKQAEILVTHHGVDRAKPFFPPWRRRDPYRLIYTSHPSKGLDSAIAVMRRVRARDRRFTLHVYGGDALWGGAALARSTEDGVENHGMIGQRELRGPYALSGFALHLQSREEPFGLSLIEAMAAGCIVIASAVGAYRELVEHEHSGVLLEGDHETDAVRDRAADWILKLLREPTSARQMRRHAAAAPLDWDTVARTWEQHWKWRFGGQLKSPGADPCAVCGGKLLALADGNHCTRCSRYSRN